ncbi:MAG TPA: hypothetical protein VNT55_09310 [Baekduia sp.]|nr:hypothetical protein [Baekduia sp.]
MLRSRALLASVVTVLLVALFAGMALAAGGGSLARSLGYGPGGENDPCPATCRWIASGRVLDEAAYAGALAGMGADAAQTAAALPGATVTLQLREPGGDWADVPASRLRPAANPQTADAAGHFTWLLWGGLHDELRVVAAHDGYVTRAGAPRAVRADGDLSVALAMVAEPATPSGGGQSTTPPAAAPAPAPVAASGATTPPKPATPKGCAAKRGTARAACERAARLATALKACRSQKGAKRKTCEKRARALSACDAKKGKQRTACRRKAQAIGRAKKSGR